MASVKNLKKDINYTLGDIIGEAISRKKAGKESEAIIDEAIETFDALIAKVHAKDVENKKAHYKAISEELETKAKALVDKVNKL